MIRFVTLGDLRLEGPTGTLLARRRKEVALLAYVARHAPHAVSREELAALLWGERSDAKSRQSLRHALHQIRRALGDAIEVTPDDVRVLDGAIELDATLLEREVERGEFAEAIDRWGGDFLAGAEDAGDERYRSWLEQEREALRRTVRSAFARQVATVREQNQLDAELQYSRRWSIAFPHDADAHRSMIEALVRSGDVDAAQAAHDAYVARLRTDLDLLPSHEIAQLGDELLRVRRQSRDRRPGSGALFTPDLVGRDAVLAPLHELWAGIRDTSGLVLVEGEEGVGKTRLCMEFVRRVRAHAPALVIDGRALAGDQGTPWATLQRMLAPLIEGAAIENAPSRAIGDLSAALPALRVRFPHLAAPAAFPDRLPNAFRDVIRALASRSPVLIVCDDFTRADAESQALLLSFARDLPAAVLVILAVRPEELAETSSASLLGQLPAARRVKLPPLTPADVAALINSMLAIAPRDREVLAERVAMETGGNPFFITELVAGLADEGVLTLNAGGTWQLDPAFPSRVLPMPPTLRGAIKRRLARLSDAARSLVTTLASLDRPADGASLFARSGLEPGTFDAAIDELLSRRILRVGGPSTYEFTHELVRRVASEPANGGRETSRPGTDPVANGIRKRRTLLSVPYAVAASLVVSVMAATAFFVRGADGKLVSAPEVRVVVAPFANETGDGHYDALERVSAEWLTRGIAQTGLIAVSPPLAGDTGHASFAQLQRTAVGTSATHIITGAVERFDDSLRFSARITDAASGTVVREMEPVVTPASRPMDGLETLRQNVVTALAPRADVRLSGSASVQSTTPSYEAYRTFTEGLENVYALRGGIATHLLRRAYELDTTFTLPLLYLAIEHDSRGEFAEAQSLLRSIRQRGAVLPPYDRYLVEYQEARLSGDRNAEFAAASRAAAIAPGSFAAVFLAPRAAMQVNLPARAVEYLERVEPERTAAAGLPWYWNTLAHAYHMLGRYQDQLAIAREVRRRLPSEERAMYYEARALAALGLVRELDVVLDAALSWPSGPRYAPPGLGLHIVAAGELRAHGDSARARQVLERALAFYAGAPADVRALPHFRNEIVEILYQTGRLSEARVMLERLEEERPFDDRDMLYVTARLGYVAVLQGDTIRVAEIDRELSSPPEGFVWGANTAHRARLAALRGRKDDAMRLFRQAMAEGVIFDHTLHHAFELQSLRSHAPFEAWLRPRG